MTMPSAWLNTLKARLGFVGWSRAARQREQVFIWNYQVLGTELPGRQLIRNRVVPLRGGVRINKSVWRGGEQEPAAAVVWVDSAEHPSREQAYEALVELAGEFHLPVGLQHSTGDLGDVCLWTPDGGWFAFAQGNIVVRVTVERPAASPVRTIALQFQTALANRPSGAVQAGRVRRIPLSSPTTRGGLEQMRGSLAELDAEIEGAPGQAPCIKIFIRGGRVALERGFMVVPEAPKIEIEAFVIRTGEPARFRRYETEVSL